MSAGPLSAAERPPHADRGAVLADVRQMITDVIGEEYLLDVEIGMDTAFADDLEIESIEFVALAERIHDRFGDQVDFVAWLAGKELDEIIELTVGELVTFVASSTETADA